MIDKNYVFQKYTAYSTNPNLRLEDKFAPRSLTGKAIRVKFRKMYKNFLSIKE